MLLAEPISPPKLECMIFHMFLFIVIVHCNQTIHGLPSYIAFACFTVGLLIRPGNKQVSHCGRYRAPPKGYPVLPAVSAERAAFFPRGPTSPHFGGLTKHQS
jgi:hypothetical protein